MAQHGVSLQSHALELVKCLEQLQRQRAALVAAAQQEEAEQARLQQDAQVLQRRLAQLQASLDKKAASKDAFDRVISQTEAALGKIVESSSLLLTVTKGAAAEISAMAAGSSSPRPG